MWFYYRDSHGIYHYNSILSLSVISLITLHGLPAARLWGGISLVTTLPAPITEPSPIVTGHTSSHLMGHTDFQQSSFLFLTLYRSPSQIHFFLIFRYFTLPLPQLTSHCHSTAYSVRRPYVLLNILYIFIHID